MPKAKINNILNQREESADLDIDKRIKRNIVWLSVFTLFYVLGGLKIETVKSGAFFGITLNGITETKFLLGLLVLVFVAWVRLVYRIWVSTEYNKHFDSAASEIVRSFRSLPSREVLKEDIIDDEIFAAYMGNASETRKIDQFGVGLGIPYVMGCFAVIATLNQLCSWWAMFIITLFVILSVYIAVQLLRKII